LPEIGDLFSKHGKFISLGGFLKNMRILGKSNIEEIQGLPQSAQSFFTKYTKEVILLCVLCEI
jgi:hypothetical protein